ncbi:MAG: hypothetical protein ACK5LK_09840, partial [Chthoniobacterales bacterium]
PGAGWDGRTIFRNGKPVGIELNAALLKDNAAIDRVFQHELAEWANGAGVFDNLWNELTSDERKLIDTQLKNLGYAKHHLDPEKRARAIELLANNWSKRGWFQKAVAALQEWANKAGFKLTRKAAERIAARAIVNAKMEVNKTNKSYSSHENGESRYSRTPQQTRPLNDALDEPYGEDNSKAADRQQKDTLSSTPDLMSRNYLQILIEICQLSAILIHISQ